MIDDQLLKILACPACRGEVELKDGKIVLIEVQLMIIQNINLI